MNRSRVAYVRIAHWARHAHPAKVVLIGYLAYLFAGWLLLCLPWMQHAPGVSMLDNLFTAVSAMSTTGLVTVSIGNRYTPAGQIVVMLLIQLGGVGYMTFGSFVMLMRGDSLTLTRRKVGGSVFALPGGFPLDAFIRNVILFTFAAETIGAIAMHAMFRDAGMPDAAWSAVFHSVSAFCTAGFSLYDDSFVRFADHPGFTVVIGALSYLGAIGFIVSMDAWRLVTRQSAAMTLTSRIILWSTLWLSLGGTLLIFLGEPSIAGMPAKERWLAAFFQAMTALTTVGFNTIAIGEMSKASLFLLILLMVVGASPSGTGGGVKSTTVSAVFGVMRSALRGEEQVRFWGQAVPPARVWLATANLGFYLFILVVGTYLLELTQSTPVSSNAFEAASALGTVGLSMGITASLTMTGKWIVICLMYLGRVGPLTFGMALFFRPVPAQDADITKESDLAV